jgi:hypothetical protein
MRTSIVALIFLAVASSYIYAQSPPRKPTQKPESTQKALTFLLASSEEEIPAGSSCHGLFGQDGPPRVRDLMAMELSSLFRGNNSIAGKCDQDKSCSVKISHELGEAVSSAEISFKVKDGRVRLDSLSCILTP